MNTNKFLGKIVAIAAIPSLAALPLSSSAATVTLTMQDSSFPTQVNNGGDFFNNGSTELGMWANTGSKQTAGWANLGTSGFGGTARNLQVGDVFTITVSATRAFGQIGFSLNNGGTQGTSYDNRTSGSRLYINTDNYGSWYVGGLSGGATSTFNYNPSQDTYRDYQFKIFITSETTGYAELYVNGTYQSTANNLTLGGTAGENISALSIYGADMWDGSSNDNAYWKQTSTISDAGSVNVGYNLGGSSTFGPGVIANGLAANSASEVITNSVNIGGSSGSVVILNDASTYGGTTTINSAATARAANNDAFGTNGAVTVTSGGALQMSNNISVARAVTLNGTGVGDAGGALRNVSGNNTNSGAISLGANSRINTDSGTLTLSGGISGGANVLYVGGASNTTVNSVISGSGASQNSTTTSLFKDGAATLTLSGNNTYTGDTRVTAGRLTVASGGNLGSGSDVFISDGAVLAVDASATVASIQETGNNNGGEVAIGTGATLTINGANKGTLFQDTISGVGNLVVDGSGDTSLSLYGTQSWSGTTTVSGGKLSTGVALGTSELTISGGTFETSAANILGNVAVNLTSGTYSLGGADTVSSFSISGGEISGANTLTASTYALNGGTVSAGLGAGALTVSTGTTTLGSAGRLNSASSLTMNSGQLTLGGNETVSSLAGSGGLISLGSGTLTLGGNSYSNNFAGVISGTGSLVKNGTGYLTLSGVNTYSGGTLLNGGTLDADNSSAFGTGSVTVGSGTILDLLSHNITNLIVNNGGTISSSGTVSNIDAEAGTTTISGANSTVTQVSGTATVNVNAADVAVNSVTGGTVTSDASGSGMQVASVSSAATINVGGTNARVATMSGGTVNANAAGLVVTNYNGGNIAVSNGLTVGLRGGSSSGVISGSGGVTKQSASTLTLSGVNTYTGATTVEAGKLVVNGSLVSATTVQTNATLGGSGTVASAIIQSGGTIDPGNSPGTLTLTNGLTWNGGGNYNWQIFDADDGLAAGASDTWDLIAVTGGVWDFSGLSSGNKFNINLWSLSGISPDTNGPVYNFDNTSSYSWEILTYTSLNGDTNTLATLFNLNTGSINGTSGFTNDLAGGVFSLVADGNSLNLLFTPGGGPGPSPVPEPGTWAAAALLAGAAGYVRWRRRKEVEPKA